MQTRATLLTLALVLSGCGGSQTPAGGDAGPPAPDGGTTHRPDGQARTDAGSPKPIDGAADVKHDVGMKDGAADASGDAGCTSCSPPPMPEASVCPSLCSSDKDCAMSCPATPGERSCCSADTKTCFNASADTQWCPEVPDAAPDAGCLVLGGCPAGQLCTQGYTAGSSTAGACVDVPSTCQGPPTSVCPCVEATCPGGGGLCNDAGTLLICG